MKTTLKIKNGDGMTVVSNDRGDKWECLGNMPELYSLGALVFFTLQSTFRKCLFWSSRFEIEMTITCLPEKTKKK